MGNKNLAFARVQVKGIIRNKFVSILFSEFIFAATKVKTIKIVAVDISQLTKQCKDLS